MSHGYDQIGFSYNSNCFNTNYTTVSDEESRILSWISPLKPRKRHSDVARARAKGVGEWVLQSDEFQAWRRAENGQQAGRILFGRGAPGAGKTFICSLIIDKLCDGTGGRNVAVGCLYCDYRGQKEQTTEVMIGSLLRQFVAGLPEIPEVIKQAFRVAKTHLGGRAPELAKIIELFPPVLECFRQVFICVDALDEFALEYRAGFLGCLREILAKSPNTKLFLTARAHIQSVVESSIPLDIIAITIQPLFSDIEMYLLAKLDTDPHHGAMDNRLRFEILTKILKESSEIFLLVALQVDSILGEVTIGGRRKKVQEMTNDLSDSYTATLERIRSQRGALARFGISALMWILLAERPLLVDELCHALAIEVGSPGVDTDMVPPIETVVASCMGLVTIDHVSSTVRLVHATLKDYLRSHQENIFLKPHATIAEVCLSYIGIQPVRELAPDLQTVPHEFPLLSYASCHWGAHARKELTASVKHLALGVLGKYPQHAAASIFLSKGGAPWRWRHSSAGFSGLHYVAYFGIDGLLEAVLSMEPANLNLTDEWGRTPLILAAGKGNARAVRILISRADVDPNSADRYGQTPLSRASATGHEGVVRTLLSRSDVNPDSADWAGRTPLFRASADGHEGVVRTLLSRTDINPNSQGWRGQTPLFIASANGHEGAVKALLNRADINPNSADQYDQTPLFQASTNGHEGVVRTLLSRSDVNPNSPDGGNRAPLFQASANGHEGVVRTLLSRADINPNSPDWRGRTPLFIASANGHAEVIRALLSRGDVNPNSADRHGQTPLFQASANGHEEAVRILITRSGVNPNSADRYDQTPLFRASANGHPEVITALLSRADINLNSADQADQTLLFQASANGYEEVVRILLSRTDINPNSEDQYGQTPLFQASANGHEGVVRNLLNRADVDPNLADWGRETPLFRACSNGHERVVKTLLNCADVNPNSSNWAGRTPLSQASANGHEGVVRILLSRADISPYASKGAGQTPLLLAAKNGHEGLVRIILSRIDINPSSAYWAGQIALFVASENGHEGVVRILLSRADVHPNLADMYGYTPLRIAASNQRHEIVNLLQDRQQIS